MGPHSEALLNDKDLSVCLEDESHINWILIWISICRASDEITVSPLNKAKANTHIEKLKKTKAFSANKPFPLFGNIALAIYHVTVQTEQWSLFTQEVLISRYPLSNHTQRHQSSDIQIWKCVTFCTVYSKSPLGDTWCLIQHENHIKWMV